MEINTIIQGDCLEIMKQMPDNCVDLTITSPPYNTGGKSASKNIKSFYNDYKDNLKEDEYYEFLKSRIKESIRISRYAFWNIQMLSGNKQVLIKIMQDFTANLKDISIWRKQAVAQVNKGIIAKGFEFILMFGKNDSMVFDYNNFPENGYVPNVIELYKKEYIKEHHATFPRNLPKYFITNFTKDKDLVLDPFMGSGTTAASCELMNRNYIGIEISPEYCEIARKRVQEAKDSMGLFK